MKNVIFILLILLSFITEAQVKKKSDKQSSISEIDKLYEKYNDSKTITLYTPYGELTGNVSIKLNDNKKPISVSINGQANSKDAIKEFLENTIKMKMKQGYAITEGNIDYLIYKVDVGFQSTAMDDNQDAFNKNINKGVYISSNEKDYCSSFLMRKGSMYFKIDLNNCNGRIAGINGDEHNYFIYGCYSWQIETCDSKRQGGKRRFKF